MRAHFQIVLLILGIAFAAGSSNLSAQNLQFSRVFRVFNVEDTVPSGKTWKIENFWESETLNSTTTQANSCSVPSRHHPFYINGAQYWVFRHSENYTSLIAGNEFPIWLESGARVRTECPDDFVSILEFTIQP